MAEWLGDCSATIEANPKKHSVAIRRNRMILRRVGGGATWSAPGRAEIRAGAPPARLLP